MLTSPLRTHTERIVMPVMRPSLADGLECFHRRFKRAGLTESVYLFTQFAPLVSPTRSDAQLRGDTVVFSQAFPVNIGTADKRAAGGRTGWVGYALSLNSDAATVCARASREASGLDATID